MSRDKISLGPALRAMAKQERGALGKHPSLDEWAAYHEGRTEADEADRLRDHLVRCPECSQLVMEWISFAGPVPPEGARPIPRGELDLQWKRLRPRLDFSTAESAPPPAPAPLLGGNRMWRIPTWLPASLAAVFFFATVGLGVQVAKLRGVSQEPSELIAGYAPRDLHPAGDEERGGESEDGSLFWDSTYSLFLHPAAPGEFPFYRYVVVEAEDPGQVVKETESPASEDGFTLLVRKHEYPPGHYRVQLYGVQSGSETLINEFEFEVKKR